MKKRHLEKLFEHDGEGRVDVAFAFDFSPKQCTEVLLLVFFSLMISSSRLSRGLEYELRMMPLSSSVHISLWRASFASGLKVLVVGEHLFQLSRVTGEQGIGRRPGKASDYYPHMPHASLSRWLLYRESDTARIRSSHIAVC